MAIQLTPELEVRIQKLAMEHGRHADDLAEEILTEYLGRIETLTAEVTQAEEEADRNGWLTSEGVMARITERRRKAA